LEDLFDVAWLPGAKRIAYGDISGAISPPPWLTMNEDGSDVRRLSEAAPTFAGSGLRVGWITTSLPSGIAGVSSTEVVGFRILAATRVVRVVRQPVWPEDVTLSPDRHLVAYIVRTGLWAGTIFTAPTRPGPPRPLTYGGKDAAGLTWSPDGKKIAFVRNIALGLGPDLYVINADGRGQRLIAQGIDHAAWSPDGHKLVVASGNKIQIINLRGSTIRSIASGDLSSVAWAPSKNIAYVQDTGDPYQAKCAD
jgi:hypothetical protein